MCEIFLCETLPNWDVNTFPASNEARTFSKVKMIVVAETNKNDPKHNRLYNVHQFIFQTVDNKEKSKLSFIHSVLTALRTTFLPVGYPASVRPEYLTYQFWDSLQGISSYVSCLSSDQRV